MQTWASPVGRVGALAVALGVGWAMFASIPMALADNSESSGRPGVNSSAKSGGSGPSTTTQVGLRSNPARRAFLGGSGSRWSGPDAGTGPAGDGVSQSRRPGNAAASTAPGHRNHPMAAVTETVDKETVSAQIMKLDPVPQSSSVPAARSVLRAAATELRAAAVTAIVSPAAAAAPAMTAAAPRGAVGASGSNVLSWLGTRTDGGAPAAGPLVWATLAAARREFDSTPVSIKPGPAAWESTRRASP